MYIKKYIKIDGPKFLINEKNFFCKKGDQKSVTIAAASIIAKCLEINYKNLAVIIPLHGKRTKVMEQKNMLMRLRNLEFPSFTENVFYQKY